MNKSNGDAFVNHEWKNEITVFRRSNQDQNYARGRCNQDQDYARCLKKHTMKINKTANSKLLALHDENLRMSTDFDVRNYTRDFSWMWKCWHSQVDVFHSLSLTWWKLIIILLALRDETLKMPIHFHAISLDVKADTNSKNNKVCFDAVEDGAGAAEWDAAAHVWT